MGQQRAEGTGKGGVVGRQALYDGGGVWGGCKLIEYGASLVNVGPKEQVCKGCSKAQFLVIVSVTLSVITWTN